MFPTLCNVHNIEELIMGTHRVFCLDIKPQLILCLAIGHFPDKNGHEITDYFNFARGSIKHSRKNGKKLFSLIIATF